MLHSKHNGLLPLRVNINKNVNNAGLRYITKFFSQSTSTSITLLYIKNSVKMSREILIHFVNEETGKQGLSGFPKITHQVDGKVKIGFLVS